MNTLMRKNPDFFGGLMEEWLKPTEFNREFSVPKVNIKETEQEYVLEVAAPGLDKEDFNIEVNEGILKLSASKKSESEEKNENYTRKEFGFQRFERNFVLPKNLISLDKIQAKYDQGILKLRLPKQDTKETVTKVTVQ
ncbi:MAG: Hsp20/alpha crystallin family protein [Moheibacter sp.]